MITVRIIGEEESREEKKSTEWISTEKDNKYSIPKESLSFVHCLCCVTRPFPVEKTDGMKMRLKRDWRDGLTFDRREEEKGSDDKRVISVQWIHQEREGEEHRVFTLEERERERSKGRDKEMWLVEWVISREWDYDNSSTFGLDGEWRERYHILQYISPDRMYTYRIWVHLSLNSNPSSD